MRIASLFVTATLYISMVQGFLPRSQRKKELSLNVSLEASKCDVAIFGGGFGGLYTALSLSRAARMKGEKLDITIVDPSSNFVFLPLLYDLTVGSATSAEVCPTYDDILKGTGVRHIKGSLESFTSVEFCSATLRNVEELDASNRNNVTQELHFRSSVLAVGSSPQASLAGVPGALENVQPFYTQEDAYKTSEILEYIEDQISQGKSPRIAIVGGGYGGVELAACIKRRLKDCQVRLLTRGPPMKGTRAEKLVDKALDKLGVEIEISTVQQITKGEDAIIVKRQLLSYDADKEEINEEPWSSVFWTAGAGPSPPVSGSIDGLLNAESGRIAVESTLRCIPNKSKTPQGQHAINSVWALGDCAEIIDKEKGIPAAPKTAQAAMQQADVVAQNVLAELTSSGEIKVFQYQDLGTMLSLGGPNAAVLAPVEESPLAPVFKPLLDTARIGFGIADKAFVNLSKSSVVETLGLSPVVDNFENLGLSLGGYGLGVDSETSPGTLAGTLTGAARRAVYAARMPTNKQRATAVTSAAISTAAALAKEAAQNFEEKGKRL